VQKWVQFIKNAPNDIVKGVSVEMQGFEPWSRQGSQRAFYVRIYAWIFEELQAHIRPLKFPYPQLGFAAESRFFVG
jgi:hypothetical protein